MTPPSKRATVITDASYHANTGAGGWAAWIVIDGGVRLRPFGKLVPCPDSTVAETLAALNGVWVAANHGATDILLQTDCMAVVDLLAGKVKAPRLVALWQEAMAMPLLREVRLTGRHVKGHDRIVDARTWVNDWCDRHARLGMETARNEALRRKAGEDTRPEGTRGGGPSQRKNPSRRFRSWS